MIKTYEEMYWRVEDALRRAMLVVSTDENYAVVDIGKISLDDPMWSQKYLAILDVLLKTLKEKYEEPLFVVFHPDFRAEHLGANIMTKPFFKGRTYHIVFSSGKHADKGTYDFGLSLIDMPYRPFFEIFHTIHEKPRYVNILGGNILKYHTNNMDIIDALSNITYLAGCYGLIAIIIPDAIINPDAPPTYLIPGKVAKTPSRPHHPKYMLINVSGDHQGVISASCINMDHEEINPATLPKSLIYISLDLNSRQKE